VKKEGRKDSVCSILADIFLPILRPPGGLFILWRKPGRRLGRCAEWCLFCSHESHSTYLKVATSWNGTRFVAFASSPSGTVGGMATRHAGVHSSRTDLRLQSEAILDETVHWSRLCVNSWLFRKVAKNPPGTNTGRFCLKTEPR
jgi:uncharacterized protein YfiM (DUF2279 family)